MKSIVDRARLARRARAAHAASLAGLAAILGSVALALFRPDQATAGLILLVGGFAIATIGTAQANRWVKRPRPEDVLDQALKGLDDQYRLYHYRRGVPPHLLLTPADLVVIECRAGEGLYRFRQGRWSQKITLGKALRFFVEEPLGDPLREAEGIAALLTQALQRRLPEDTAIAVRAIIVFTHPAAIVEADASSIPIVQPKQLRRHAAQSGRPLPRESYAAVRALLDAGVPGGA